MTRERAAGVNSPAGEHGTGVASRADARQNAVRGGRKYPQLVKEWRDRWGIGRLYIDRTESGKYYAYVVRPSLPNPVERVSPLFRRKKDLEEWLKEGME